jgi:hypothetical protein
LISSVTNACFHFEQIKKNCADIKSINSFSSLSDILLPFPAKIHPPDRVSHILVALGVGLPFAT